MCVCCVSIVCVCPLCVGACASVCELFSVYLCVCVALAFCRMAAREDLCDVTSTETFETVEH